MTDKITEHEIANIGNLTITVTHYLGKHSKEWRTDLNLIAYADHIAFDVETAHTVIAALSKAIVIAESYTAPQPERDTDYEWRETGPQGRTWYRKDAPK